MRDPQRIKKILHALETIWSKQPDIRFGQLLINLLIVNDNIRLWNNEDDALLDFLNNRIKEMKKTNKSRQKTKQPNEGN